MILEDKEGDLSNMAERIKSNSMSEKGQSHVASILLEVHVAAIARLAGTHHTEPQDFADMVRALSTKYTDPDGVIDKSIGHGLRDKVREAITDFVSFGAEQYLQERK